MLCVCCCFIFTRVLCETHFTVGKNEASWSPTAACQSHRSHRWMQKRDNSSLLCEGEMAAACQERWTRALGRCLVPKRQPASLPYIWKCFGNSQHPLKVSIRKRKWNASFVNRDKATNGIEDVGVRGCSLYKRNLVNIEIFTSGQSNLLSLSKETGLWLSAQLEYVC